MSPKGVGPIARAWYKWKALRLPWRKRFLVGFDLEGNTYWEFRLAESHRWRRIVHYPRSAHLSSVKVSPQWHQWLRHARPDPPALEEQRAEVLRQEEMKRLAAAADARWEAKPRLVPTPDAGRLEGQQTKQPKEEDPWAKARTRGPGEDWQPTAWNPGKKG